MHVLFMPYGRKEIVDILLRDMMAQKMRMKLWKDGEPERMEYIESQIRYMPFGIYDYVCTREELDAVLTTLLEENFKSEDDPYEGIGHWKIAIIRKMLRCEPLPEFKRDRKFLWMKKHVGIIPIGIRKDGDITEAAGDYKGWSHERI